MKNSKLKKIITKVMGALLLVSVLVGAMTVSFPTSVVYAADEVTELGTSTGFTWGSTAIKDPETKGEAGNIYYSPTTYIYCGTYFDMNKRAFVPVLCRVLDAEADNKGAPGAMFLLTENGINNGMYLYNYVDEYMSRDVEWENVYTKSNMYRYDKNNGAFPIFSTAKTSEKAYIRPITKEDVKVNMKNLYGYEEGISPYYFETDSAVYDANVPFYEYATVSGNSATYLDGSKFFLLSIEEVYKYIGTYNGAPGLGTTNLGDEGAVWLTRTGLGETYPSTYDNPQNMGNFVAGVDANGNIVPVSADDTTPYARIAFNLETEDMVFTQNLGQNKYRVAFTHPEYQTGTANPFTVNVINTDTVTNKVTLEYTNTYRLPSVDLMQAYISVIIESSDGTIKSYGNIKTLENGYEYFDTTKGTVDFVLPDGYTESDKIHVFWEYKPIDGKGISYVSNLVELDCLHTTYDKATDTYGTAPTCVSPGRCAHCGEEFGYKDDDAHSVDTSKYYHGNEGGIDLHWNLCEIEGCGKKLNVKACTFSGNCHLTCNFCNTGKEDRSRCSYDENGICEHDPNHYESPAYVANSGYVEAIIGNEGQWISLANTINNGEIIRDANGNTVYIGGGAVNIVLVADLNFEGISGFVPMGTEETGETGSRSARGTLSCRGGEFTISGIKYESEGANVGLFGFAESLRIRNITLTNCEFTGSSNVGALVGKASDVSVSETKVIGDVKVSAADGTEGAFFGTAISGEFINTSKITFASVAYGVTNEAGENLPFVPSTTPDEAISIDGSFCLTDTDGERGSTSAATFASGLVAHKLQGLVPGWSQVIDKVERDEANKTDIVLPPEAFPKYIPKDENGNRIGKVYRVYMISYCDDETVSMFTNNAKNNYSIHKPKEILDWNWDDSALYCEAHFLCELCGEEVVMEAEVELDYTYVPVRGDYTATLVDPNGTPFLDENGEPFTSEKTIIARYIQDMIGMTYIDKIYDTNYVSPDEDMMNNHRLNTGTPGAGYREYMAYFVDENGNEMMEKWYNYYGQPEYRPVSVRDVGVYDLVVVGKNAYEGQKYVYEDALTIRPAVVEIEPKDVYKYKDGTANFAPEYKLVDPEMEWSFRDGFTILYGEASSAEEGVYSVPVSVINEMGDENVQFVLTRESVQAVILPTLFVKVENKDYPTQFVYGDTLPTPVADNFTFTEGSELTFEWYAADVKKTDFDIGGGVFEEQYEILSIRRIESMPKNAGDYVLRVKAGGVGTLAASYCDVVIEIEPSKSLEITVNTEGLTTYESDYYTFYVIDVGQFPNGFEYTVNGLIDGDTLESAGIEVYVQTRAAEGGDSAFEGFPKSPSSENYIVSYSLRCEPADGSQGNYETDGVDKASAHIYVMVKSGASAKPVSQTYLANGSAQAIGVVLSWQAFDGAEQYTVTVKGPGESGATTTIVRSVGNDLTDDIRYGNIFADYTLTKAGTYTVSVYAGAYDSNNKIDEYTFTVSITKDDAVPVESVTSITDMGKYTVTVTTGDVANPVVNSAEILVQREIVMLVKEMEYNILGGELVFDRTNIVMEAGKVILIGHKLADVKLGINYHWGEVTVESFKVVLESDESVDVTYLYSLNTVVYAWSHSNEEGRNVVHIFDSACDTSCNIQACEYTRVAAHTGGEATCVSQAICERCQVPYGDFSKDVHVSENTHFAPNGADLETHLRIHSCCGQTAEVLPHTEGVAATCISRAVCADCGWEYGELDPHNHASDTLTYEYVGEAGHKAIHSGCCNSYEIEAHTGGEATCIALAECEHCESEYGMYDADNHSGHIEYTPDPENAGYHIEEYSCCDESAKVAHSGGVETCVSRAICEHCGAEYGNIDPHNHTSENLVYTVRADNASMHDITHECCGAFVAKEYHSGGHGTCISSAVCELCNTEYGGDTDASNHVSEEIVYKRDPAAENIHIAVHACCGKEISREAHSGGEATCTSGALCEHCGAEYGEHIDHEFDNACDSVCNICEKQVRPLIFHEDENNDNKCDECGAVIDETLAVSEESEIAEELSASAVLQNQVQYALVENTDKYTDFRKVRTFLSGTVSVK